MQIQCAQCHNHPTDRWKREQFHELAAFFPRIAVRPVNNDDKRSFQWSAIANGRRPLKQANAPRQPRALHARPEASGSGRHDDAAGLLPHRPKAGRWRTRCQAPRKIAEWITAPSDQWFAKAFVNRIWAELVGSGFYEPIDDIGPDRTCTAPKTLDYLPHEFSARKYDVKWLFRIIVATEAYQRESRTHSNPRVGRRRNCPQRLRGDELFDALIAALGIPDGAFSGGRPASRCALAARPVRPDVRLRPQPAAR